MKNPKQPMPVPPEFAETFIRKGWRKCESIWGKATTQHYRRAIGDEKLEGLRKALKDA